MFSRTPLRAVVALSALCTLVLGALAADKDDKKTGDAKLNGTWKAVSGEADGKKKPVPGSLYFVFAGDKLTIKENSDQTASIKVDSSKKPAHIDITLVDGKEKRTMEGIWKLEGDTLTLAVAPKRPTTFGGKDVEVMTFKKTDEKVAVKEAGGAAAQIKAQNNLMQLALALHTIHDDKGKFPEAAISDKKGKALLSWRVAILPYIEEQKLYNEFKLDEPWDSAHNKKLLARMPKLYENPRFQSPGSAEGKTYYQGFTGKGTCWGATLAKIASADGSGNTLMIVEAGDPVPWTKPEDLAYDAKKPLPKLGGPKRESFLAAFCDGHVQKVPAKTDEPTLRALITYDDGKKVAIPQEKPTDDKKK